LTIFFLDKLSNLNQQTKDKQFENVVAVTFQSAFHLEIDQNIFFLKIIFDISISK
jgi:hypothetical protein